MQFDGSITHRGSAENGPLLLPAVYAAVLNVHCDGKSAGQCHVVRIREWILEKRHLKMILKFSDGASRVGKDMVKMQDRLNDRKLGIVGRRRIVHP